MEADALSGKVSTVVPADLGGKVKYLSNLSLFKEAYLVEQVGFLATKAPIGSGGLTSAC